jgi:formamidopyrimidine-DNA glycosylase
MVAVPELPEMQALAERLDTFLVGKKIERIDAISFSGLATVDPPFDALVGEVIERVTRRGKYLVIATTTGLRVLVHLAQAGRLDLEVPAKSTRPRGAILRMTLDGGLSVLVREHGHERSARWWVLGRGDDGPLGGLGPEVTGDRFASVLLDRDDNRRIHTILRDQSVAAGVGRGYADDALNRAGISPFSSLRSLDRPTRERLVTAVRATIDEALAHERGRDGGLSAARLGDRFAVHNRSGQPCPRCGDPLHKVSYASTEIVYCPGCQTNGRIYADRRMSRLFR